MNLNDYQKQAMTTATYKDDTTGLMCSVLGLNGEAGEVAEKLKKIIRDKSYVITEIDKAMIAKELGDVLWYVASLSDLLGFSLDSVAQLNLSKLADRYERGVIKGSGDER